MEDELKWMTPRKTWKYIPNRYQALTAQIVAALLYFNLFDVLLRGKLHLPEHAEVWFVQFSNLTTTPSVGFGIFLVIMNKQIARE